MPSRILRTLAIAACPFIAHAGDDAFDARFQSTWIWQSKPAMRSPYEGPHSLAAGRDKGYSFSATGFFTWRLAPAVEFTFNPEVVQGVPLSRLQGLGGMTNGEAQKSSGPKPVAYRARAFLRRTWGEGDERTVASVGNFAVNDLFDKSESSGDPRTQFLNWSFITHGAFDFPADARGYTNGAALELYRGAWQLRGGRFLLPKEPNGTALDWRALGHFGDVIEAVHGHQLGDLTGNVRVLAFRNRATMASFGDALASANGSVPSLDAVRAADQTKRGWGVAADQQLGHDIGVFARAGRSDGRTEVYAFAEIDRSVSAGMLAHGSAWGRGRDTAGIALARNDLSGPHRAYLAAGGLGFFVGDSRLRYAGERIAEVFYSAALGPHLALSLDAQWIRNPGYNADRGPARFFAARVHTEF